MPTLGVDPGSDSGAAVLLNGDRVLGWWAWRLMRRKSGDRYRVRRWCAQTAEATTLPAGLRVIASDVRQLAETYRLCVEGIFVPTWDSGRASQAPIPLAESAGMALAAFDLYATSTHRVEARVWRPMVAGIPGRTKAAKAEALAVQRAGVLFSWPALLGELTDAERGAVSEAAFIARYGAAFR